MRFAQVPVNGAMKNFAYVLGDDATGEGAVVDPGADADRLLGVARSLGVRVTHVLLTHGHHDHVDEAPLVARATGARIAAHPLNPAKPGLPLADGQVVRLGDLEVQAHWTPGHARDAVCYEAGGKLFTGDTLFVGECGRTDLPGSDPGAMWHSLLTVLARLPRALEVCPGHDYGPSPTSTLEREFRDNYVLKPRTREEFVRFMAEP